DDGAAQPEVRAGPAAEVLAAGDVPAPEDRPARRTGVARARDVHEVAAPDARQRVVVDLRLEVHVVVAHLATGAAVSPDVRRLRRDVLLAAVQLDTLDAPLAQEGGHLVAPPGLRAGIRDVEDEAAVHQVEALERVARPRRRQVAEHLGLDAVVARVA